MNSEFNFLEKNFLTKRIPKINLFFAVLIVLFSTLIIGYIDYITGKEFSFSVFYLIPITLASFYSGKTFGLITSIICAVIWLFQDTEIILNLSRVYFLTWSLLTKIVFFLLFNFLINSLLNALAHVKELSLHDPLTSAANGRFFEEYSNNLIKRAIRNNTPLTFAFFDLDNFKELNDTLGHSTGDDVLKLLSNIVMKHVRPDDIFARLGGDEFAIILYGLNYKTSEKVIKRIVNEIKTEMENKKWNITLSVGAITYKKFDFTIKEMLVQVDDLSYEVKHSGKNKIKHIEYPDS